MNIFGRQTPAPTRINQVQMNQSVLGYAVAVVMGCGKIQQSILWLDGFVSALINSGGGKGGGGGKDGNQYVYSADVIAGLCAGSPNGIRGIGDVWSGQSWLSTSAGAETWTIVAGAPYTPANAADITGDKGVSETQSYSGSYADLGAGTPTTLSGTHKVPYARVPYGSPLSSGEYSVDPAGNYHASDEDAGKTVTVDYSYSLATIKKQDKDLITSSLNIPISGTTPFQTDGGVVYFDEAGGPTNGVPLTKVSGAPTVAGTYSVDPGQYDVSGSAGSYTITATREASYSFAPGDIDKEVLLTYELNNSYALSPGTSSTLNFTIFEGMPAQAPPALLSSNFPSAALGYPGIVLAGYFPMDLGYGAQVQQNTFEVMTEDGWGGSIVDSNPVRCIYEVLANKVWGLGGGHVPFPVSAMDNGVGGTWGKAVADGVASADSTASSWFAANGFFISPVIDRQDTAASLIGRWLEAGQCAGFMSEGLYKLVPYGDTSTAGNGATWIAPAAFAAALDDSCFIPKSAGEDPLKISSTPWQDAYNVVQVSWNNRANQYSPELTQESDAGAINRYGQRIEDPQSWDFITTLPAAAFAASMRVKRNVYTRNTYEFTLPYQYSYLEPMDIVYITTSSVWAAGANPLGIQSLPVRIVKVVDNPEGTLDITCEDYPFGVHQPTIYNKGIAAAETQPNRYADPGNSEVVIFEATSRLTGFQGNQIWMGALGLSADWGRCNVYASTDGDKYVSVGSITKPARLGVLGAAFPSGSDPDTTDTLLVDLADNCRSLESATTADADLNNTLCFVDGELLSYSAAATTGVNEWTASGYFRRGQMGSAIASHAAGSLFLRLDDSIFKYAYDPSLYGKTIYLKFQSVNVYGNSPQDLAALTAVAFTIPGVNPGTIDASTGLVVSTHLPPNVATNVACNAIVASSYDATSATSSVFAYGPGGAGTSWTYLVGSVAEVYPAGGVTGLAPTTGAVYVVYNTQTQSYEAVSASSYENILNDFYIVLGSIAVATATGGSTGGGTGGTGTGGTGAGGGTGYGCTVEGTPLDTPDGPVDNRVLKARLDAGEAVYLSGRFGPERLVEAEWLIPRELRQVVVGVRPTIACSGSHMLRVGGHYAMVSESACVKVETRTGYEPCWISPGQINSTVRVLRVSLGGPSHEYSSHGVMTHNVKPAQSVGL